MSATKRNIMLAVTDVAAEAINHLTSSDVNHDNAGGLRFSIQHDDQSDATLSASVAPAPAPGDEVVNADQGARVFLQPEAARLLDDKVLDVQEVNGEPSFAIRERS